MVSYHHEHVQNSSSCETETVYFEFSIHVIPFNDTYDMCTIVDEHLSV